MILPDKLEAEAKYFIDSIVKKLETDGVITEIDNLSIYMMATALNDLIISRRKLEEEGAVTLNQKDREVISPWKVIYDRSFANLSSMMKQYGLTTMSRGKIKYVDNANTTDALSAFLNDEE